MNIIKMNALILTGFIGAPTILAQTVCTVVGDTNTCTGPNAIWVQSDLNYKNVVINNTSSNFSLSGPKGLGLYANGMNGNFTINNLTVNTNGSSFFLFGQTDAIRTNGTTFITVNGKLEVNAKGYSADGINVSITSNAKVDTGNDTYISSADGVAVRSNLSQFTDANNQINIGKNATIKTDGTGRNANDAAGYAIYAGSRDSGDSALSQANTASVRVGEGATIQTSNSNAYAVYANKTGYIQLGSGAAIVTKGSGAHGIVAQDGTITTTNGETQSYTGGVVDLLGNTSIDVNTSTAKAIYASGKGSLISSYNKETATQTSGVFNVNGDMLVDNGGTIDLRMTDTSSFIGNTSIADSGSTLNLDISGASSKWQMSKSSQVTNLNLANNANVLLGDQSIAVDENNKVVLNTVNLAGSGLFSMRTNIVGSGLGANNIGDLLQVTGTSKGNHLVNVSDFYNGSAAVDGSERLKIIETADGVAKFTLSNPGKYVDVGAYKYALNAGDKNYAEDPNYWYLSAKNDNGGGSGGGDLTNTADRSVSILAMNYLLNYAEMQTLLNRMGELHKGRDKDWDFWIRGFTGKMNSFNGSISRFDFTYHGFQVGLDR